MSGGSYTQLTLFDWLGEVTPFSPLAEVVRKATAGYGSRAKLTAMVKNGARLGELARAAQWEYAPYGFAGHYGAGNGPNTVESWSMTPKGIRVQWESDAGPLLEKSFTWSQFAETLRDMVQRGEYGEGNV